MDDFFIIQPCKGKAAFTTNLKKHKKLNLNSIRHEFENVLADTPFLIVVDYKGINVSIYEDCKLLIRTGNKKEAKEIAEEIYEKVLK